MQQFKNGWAASWIVFSLGLLLVVWSFFSAPGKLLYIRYFEAATIFNPAWVLHTYFAGWSYQWHLGAANNTEISYVAPLSLALCGLSASLGPIVASIVYPAAVSAFGYWAFVWYAASKLRSPVAACVGGVFYVANPAWIGFVHEGYSGILFVWALIPFCLRLIDIAYERDETLILAIPFIFIAGEMFQYPQVAIDWAVLLLLRFRVLWEMVSRNRYLPWGLVAGLAANLYWVLPMAVYLKTHTVLPILSETRSDVATYADYASLANAALLRTLPPMWTTAYNGVRECSRCDFYMTTYYTISMAVLALGALVGLWLRRWYGLLVVALGALVLTTGNHYAGSALGWPYQLLMALPLHGIFRSAELFFSVTTFACALGFGALLDFFWSRRAAARMASAALACAIVFCTGYLTLSGRWIERGTAGNTGVSFPNFPVDFPSRDYDAAKRQVIALVAPSQSVTLLLPATRYADYRWGAFGNDFLYGYLGTPALFEWYWPQDNPMVQNALDYVLTQKDRFSIATSLEAMRIGAVFLHGDVRGPSDALESASDYGKVVWRQNDLTVTAPRFSPLPLLQFSHDPLMTFGFRDAMRLTSGFHRAVLDGPNGALADCSRPYDVAWGRMSAPITDETPVVLSFPVPCHRPSVVEIRSYGTNPLTLRTKAVADGATSAVALKRTVDVSGVSVWTGLVADPAAKNFVVSAQRGSVDVYGIELRSTGSAPLDDEAGSFAPWLGIAQVVLAPAQTRDVVLNESFDSSWAAFALCDPWPVALRHRNVNGYANGFTTNGCQRVAIVNWAQASFAAGVVSGLLATIAAVYFWYLATASKIKRSSLAAAVSQAN